MNLHYHSFTLDRFDPVPIIQKLAPHAPGFLETLNPLPKTGKFSLLALRRKHSWRLDRQGLSRLSADACTTVSGDPFEILGQELKKAQQDLGDATPPPSPFPAGFFGWLGYDLVHWIEALPQKAQRDLPLPSLWLDWIDLALVYDHTRQLATLTSLDPTDDLHEWSLKIQHLLQQSPLSPQSYQAARPAPVLTPETFQQMVCSAKNYIASGDIYQANLSCRFDSRFKGVPLDLYRRLREINPSPFACYLNTPPCQIISSSPERLVSLRGDLAETRPIAGTRPRGFTPPEDHQLGKELLGHPKERAEHIMLLDLERNDLGKVCQAGTVEVDELMTLERYSHVTHIVSNVRGRLQQGLGPFDLIRATFPGGTITGVPKKRCMEIIDELEPVGRGIYTGSAGYISVTGEMDLNILIRSYQLIGEHLSFQVGAGIVADSVPEKEWQECLAKGAALQKALEPPC